MWWYYLSVCVARGFNLKYGPTHINTARALLASLLTSKKCTLIQIFTVALLLKQNQFVCVRACARSVDSQCYWWSWCWETYLTWVWKCQALWLLHLGGCDIFHYFMCTQRKGQNKKDRAAYETITLLCRGARVWVWSSPWVKCSYSLTVNAPPR